MESTNFDPDFEWSPDDSIEMALENGTVLQLRWSGTIVYRYTIGEGRYDHIEHSGLEGTYQFFLDDGQLRADLEVHGYPYTVSPYVEQDLVDARKQYDVDLASHEFAIELDSVVGPEDLLG